MGKFGIEIKPEAKKDFKKDFKSGDKASIRKIEIILSELQETPFSGTGQPEPLKYELTGYWSRRINKRDRMIYSVIENVAIVTIFSAIGHYEDN